MPINIIVIGGGAAGFFGAITAKHACPSATVTILEKTARLLTKVRISGGGRCNVTHACFDPKELVNNYPRGKKELLGPFHRFQPRDTVDWFESRGVRLKTESDGRMFPVSDSSEEIIACLMKEAASAGVIIRLQTHVDTIEVQDGYFKLSCAEEVLTADRLLLATGSSKAGYEWAEALGHTIQEPVPSLFTFNIPNFPLTDLAGISVEGKVAIRNTTLQQQGPLLITHWGFSGPAALKLSAFGARYLYEHDYKVELDVAWTKIAHNMVKETLIAKKSEFPNRILSNQPFFDIPKNLFKRLLERADIAPDKRLSELNTKTIQHLSEVLTNDRYQVEGKTTYKAEFVTCGGITLSEVDFKTMESRLCPNLYFAGEILDIDGITGGFNFQNAWTTSFLAGNAMGREAHS